MSQYKYSATVNEHRAKAVGLLMPISTKQSIEICKLIRGKNLQKAKKILNEAKDMKKPIPFKRFTEGAGHKHGIGAGKYPVKACREILSLVNLVEANAQHKGLDTSSLKIVHICAKKGPRSWHYGRQSRIAMKRTHVEVVVEEKEIKKKEVKKETKKAETKKEPIKEEESKPIKKQEEKKEPEEKEKPKETKKREKSKEKLKEEEHREIETKVKEIKEKLQQEDKSQSKQEPKKVLKEKKVPTATELAEKAKSKQEPKEVPTINELTKKKESKVDKK